MIIENWPYWQSRVCCSVSSMAINELKSHVKVLSIYLIDTCSMTRSKMSFLKKQYWNWYSELLFHTHFQFDTLHMEIREWVNVIGDAFFTDQNQMRISTIFFSGAYDKGYKTKTCLKCSRIQLFVREIHSLMKKKSKN